MDQQLTDSTVCSGHSHEQNDLSAIHEDWRGTLRLLYADTELVTAAIAEQQFHNTADRQITRLDHPPPPQLLVIYLM